MAVAFVPTGADDAFHIGLHDELQDGLGNAAQEVALIVLCRKLGQVMLDLVIGVSVWSVVEVAKLHLKDTRDAIHSRAFTAER